MRPLGFGLFHYNASNSPVSHYLSASRKPQHGKLLASLKKAGYCNEAPLWDLQAFGNSPQYTELQYWKEIPLWNLQAFGGSPQYYKHQRTVFPWNSMKVDWNTVHTLKLMLYTSSYLKTSINANHMIVVPIARSESQEKKKKSRDWFSDGLTRQVNDWTWVW